MTKNDLINAMKICADSKCICAGKTCPAYNIINCRNELFKKAVPYLEGDNTLSEEEETTKPDNNSIKIDIPEDTKSMEIVLHF